MAIPAWYSIIDAVKNGEPIDAVVANRAVAQLTARTDNLRARQDANDLGSAIFIDSAAVSSDTLTGHVVYFDHAQQVFAPAYAELTVEQGVVVPTPSSYPVGVVVKKHTNTSAAIVVCGLIDPTNYVGNDCSGDSLLVNLCPGGAAAPGTYFLAAGYQNRGTVVRTPGLVNSPVCQVLSSTSCVVNIQLPSVLDTQAIKVSVPNKILGPDLFIRRVDESNVVLSLTDLFTDYYQGRRVAIYFSADSGATASAILMTGVATIESGGYIGLTELEMTADMVQELAAAGGSYATVLRATVGQTVCLGRYNADGTIDDTLLTRIVLCNSTSMSCYLPPVTYSSGRWNIEPLYAGADLDSWGWAPATSSYFDSNVIPVGAKYGYKYEHHPTLGQLFPELLVGHYLLTRRGIGVSQVVAKIDNYGIWWFDDFSNLPWSVVNFNSLLPDTQITMLDWDANTAAQLIMPTELELHYSKLVSGGVRVVTSLVVAGDTTSSPLVLTDLEGNPATTGALKLTAAFKPTAGATDISGGLAVKSFDGFEYQLGPVVQDILPGANIEVVDAGNGELRIGVVGLDGKLEGEPDILAIDDVRIEKDSSLDIFYYIMPPGKNSSILGKVVAPKFLDGTYYLDLAIRALALHTSGTVAIPSLAVNWTKLADAAATAKSLNSDNTVGATTIAAVSLTPRQYKDLSLPTNARISVTAGQTVFFNLKRASTDAYTANLGLVSLSYRFTKA